MKTALTLLYLFVALTMLIVIQQNLPSSKGVDPTVTRDVYFIYSDASRLAAGENPYSRIQGKGLKKNEKYTFYLPAFLVASAASIRVFGLTNYEEWMSAWFTVSFLIHLCIGLLLFAYTFRRWGLTAGVLASAFWWFSRWPLALLRSGQIDNVGILFFVIALVTAERRHLLALLSLGTSLAVKQMAAFTVPLFISWPLWSRLFHREERGPLVKQFIALTAVPLLLSLPFLIWDGQSFLQMIIFPMTRDPSGPRSVEYFLGEVSLLGKIPFLTLLALGYYYLLREKAPLFVSTLFVMIVFLSFNPVFFSRYFCWAVPVIPLAVLECVELFRERKRATPT